MSISAQNIPRTRDYLPGMRLFNEGEQGEEMYILKEGSIKVFRMLNNEEKVLFEMQPGDFIGEMAVLMDHPRSASAQTLTSCRVLVVTKDSIKALLRNNADIALTMMKKFAERIEHANAMIKNLAEKGENLRVIQFLVDLIECDELGMRSGKMRLKIGYQELVAKVGYDDANIKIILAKLKEKALAHFDGTAISIKDYGGIVQLKNYLTLQQKFGDKF